MRLPASRPHQETGEGGGVPDLAVDARRHVGDRRIVPRAGVEDGDLHGTDIGLDAVEHRDHRVLVARVAGDRRRRPAARPDTLGERFERRGLAPARNRVEAAHGEALGDRAPQRVARAHHQRRARHQNGTDMKPWVPSQSTMSTRLKAILNPSPFGRSRWRASPPNTRRRSSRYSSITKDERARSSASSPPFLQHHVADHVARAHRRDLGPEGVVPELADADVHQIAVLVEDRQAVDRVVLVRLRRHPVDAVLGVEVAPVLEPALVDQPRLVEEEFLDPAEPEQRLDPAGRRDDPAHAAAM